MPELKPLIKHILELKKLLGENGNYSISRSDKNPMHFWELIAIGSLLEKIDNELEAGDPRSDNA